MDNLIAIKIIMGCSASGQSLVGGETYTVPDQVSDEDARLLILLGKAMAVVTPPLTQTHKPGRKPA